MAVTGFNPANAVPADSSSAPPGFDPANAELHDSSAPANAAKDFGGDTLKVYNPLGDDIDTHVHVGQDVDNALAGAGKAFVDTKNGLYQLGASIGHAAGMVSDEKMAQIQRDADDAHQRDRALLDTKAGLAGNIVAQAAPMVLAPEAGILGSGAEGAALAAAQPVSTGETRLQNAGLGALGGAAGAGVGKVLGGVLRGFGGAGGRQAAVDTLRAEGVPLSVAQTTGAKTAQHIERASAMTSDAPADFAASQGEAFNRAALRRIGVNDPAVTAATPDVLGPARAKITGVMDDVASRTNIKYDPQLESDLAAIEQNALRQVPAHDLGPIHANINDILENAATNNGSLDGSFYQRLNSNLGSLAKDSKVGDVAGDIKDAITDALQRSASPQDVAALTKARQQYRALKQIEPAIDGATGNISPLALMRSMSNKTNRSQALYGQGDQSLMNLARAAKQVMPDTLGNSGTAERSLPVLSVMETLGSGEPVKARIKLAGGKLGLDAAGRAMRNQGGLGKYLANGVAGARAAVPAIKSTAPAAGYSTLSSERGADGAEPQD